jgi:hypothetical protein
MNKLHQLTALAGACVVACHGWAAELEVNNPDWRVRFDNTVKASVKIRTEKADPGLTDSFRLLVPGVPASAFPQALNFNAGDQNFRKRGLVSERVDLLSEFDAVYRNDFGVRVSGAAWYDRELHRMSAAPSDFFNGQTPPNEFPSQTRRVAGGDAEILDAFVFGGWRLGNGAKLTARLGRHALQWGETLFFGDNGIARAQGPIDIDKLLSSPSAQFKEVIRPVPQISGNLQINPQVSIGAYYQFRWQADRLPPAGSYFSSVNTPWYGSQPEFINAAPFGNFVLINSGEREPKNTGQFGVQLKWRWDENDLGFYYARYHDKGGQLYGQLNPFTTQSPSGTLPGNWYWDFPENVKTYGASISRSFGEVNLAAEGAIRDNVPLRNTNMLYGFFPGQAAPRIATGRSAHLNVSTVATFGQNFIARESTLLAELAWNRVLSENDPDRQLDSGRTRDASAIQFVYTPTYRQVLPGLDLGVPLGLRYTLSGRSSVTAWDAKGNGTATIGVDGNYLNVWQFAVTYTHFIGPAVPFVDYSPLLAGGAPRYGWGNSLADRNFVSLSLRRTF